MRSDISLADPLVQQFVKVDLAGTVWMFQDDERPMRGAIAGQKHVIHVIAARGMRKSPLRSRVL